MRHLCEQENIPLFSIIPLTFHIRKGSLDSEFPSFKESFLKNSGLWIIKPGERSNRGNGITISDSLKEIEQVLNSKELHSNGKLRTFIVQKYIEKPFLFYKRKFDIRCYMLLTNFNRNFRGYWYKEGYIRTSAKEFSLKQNNKAIHLTNDAIQKNFQDYGKFEPFNKVSFEELEKYIENERNVNQFPLIQEKMKEIAKIAIKSVYSRINEQIFSQNSFIFEVFGLDFMLDDELNVWLLEINVNPCLETTSPLLNRIIPNMLENVFRLIFFCFMNLVYYINFRITIDSIFLPPFLKNSNKTQKLANYMENNKFILIFDELKDGDLLPNFLKILVFI